MKFCVSIILSVCICVCHHGNAQRRRDLQFQNLVQRYWRGFLRTPRSNFLKNQFRFFEYFLKNFLSFFVLCKEKSYKIRNLVQRYSRGFLRGTRSNFSKIDLDFLKDFFLGYLNKLFFCFAINFEQILRFFIILILL